MDWNVRFIDYPKQFRVLEAEIMSTIREVLASGDLIMRRHMTEFESDLAAFVGTADCVGLSNCTDGLRLTLEALGIGARDEVITVAHTFVASVAAIHHAGATPVLVDIGEDHNMDESLIDDAITPRTRAILPVHLNGRICEMDAIITMARERNLFVIEDAAQALGATLSGVPAGSFGVAAAFSFYPAKLLGAYGDAGAVVTSDGELAQKLRLLRDHGRVSKDDLDGWGYNCRLDNLQAAILLIKLKKLPEWIERRRLLSSMYDEQLGDVSAICLPPSPHESDRHYDVFQNYVIEAERRDDLQEFLSARGIETMVSWRKPLHHQSGLGLETWRLPNTERLCSRVISLPMTPELEDSQIEWVASAIREFYGET